MRMTFRVRGVVLPSWETETGLAVNKVWLEFLRREQRRDRAQAEHEMIVAYALAGSPQADSEKRFEVVDPTKKTLFAHMSGLVYRTEYKRRLLEQQVRKLDSQISEMARIDWISGDDFDLAAWAAGK